MSGELRLDLRLLSERFAISRLDAGSALPDWAAGGKFTSISWTADETSIVCAEALVPSDVQSEAGWRALKVAGPLDFELIGVLAAIAQPLAEAGVPIFAVSTYDTDYVLVPEPALETAVDALEQSGHRVSRRHEESARRNHPSG